MDTLGEVRFWAQVLADAKRTVYCAPADAGRIRDMVAAEGMAHLVAVVPSRFVEPGEAIVADTNAIEAGYRQAIQKVRPFG
jgi:hypothetical protein